MAVVGSVARPLRVAIVGAGPSGFYAAEALLRSDMSVEVDLFDRLPTPFGLVRGGVAPDHQKIKGVVRVYERVAEAPGFRFFGNVRVGHDVPVSALGAAYDQVCFATGAEGARSLGIPGEDLPGCWPAPWLVGWYNGHPDHVDHAVDLSVKAAVVVGVGDVAIDVARVLARRREELAVTDIGAAALAALRVGPLTDIHILGRRGPAQTRFNPTEVRALGNLEDVDVIVSADSARLDEASAAWLDAGGDKRARRNVQWLQEQALKTPTGAPRRIHLHLLTSPVEVLGPDRITGVRVVRNTLDADFRPHPTGDSRVIEAGLLVHAVGYRGVAIPGLPFDARKGRIPNEGGRVSPRHYVVGWAKRGPTGVIGTNKPDAADTVARMVEDAPSLPEAARPPLSLEGLRPVSWADWQRLDAIEVAAGETAGRVRVKLERVQDMLDALDREG